MMEEAGIAPDTPLILLDAVASVPAEHFEACKLWGADVYAAIERAFGVRVPPHTEIALSCEHTAYRWLH
jgi:hypothetical protein